jgi:hypothetical protein
MELPRKQARGPPQKEGPADGVDWAGRDEEAGRVRFLDFAWNCRTWQLLAWKVYLGAARLEDVEGDIRNTLALYFGNTRVLDLHGNFAGRTAGLAGMADVMPPPDPAPAIRALIARPNGGRFLPSAAWDIAAMIAGRPDGAALVAEMTRRGAPPIPWAADMERPREQGLVDWAGRDEAAGRVRFLDFAWNCWTWQLLAWKVYLGAARLEDVEGDLRNILALYFGDTRTLDLHGNFVGRTAGLAGMVDIMPPPDPAPAIRALIARPSGGRFLPRAAWDIAAMIADRPDGAALIAEMTRHVAPPNQWAADLRALPGSRPMDATSPPGADLEPAWDEPGWEAHANLAVDAPIAWPAPPPPSLEEGEVPGPDYFDECDPAMVFA